MSSTIISTILSTLRTPGAQKLLALVGGFTLAKILPKQRKASIDFSSWLACVTMTFALGIHPEMGQFPAILFMLIAGAILGSTNLISDFSPREDNNQSETADQEYINFLEADNAELDLLLDETTSSHRLELEAKDPEISDLKEFYESRLDLHEQHISALTKICQIDEAEIEALRTEIQDLGDREESQRLESEAKDRYISEVKEYYEDLISLDELHISALKQSSQDDNEYYQSQLQELKNEIQEYRDREEQHLEDRRDLWKMIDSKQHTIEILLDRTKGIASLKQERDVWKREAEILDKEIEDLYEYTEGQDGVVGLYYRCKEARTALKVADSEIKRLRTQRNEARESLNSLEKDFQHLKAVFETEFLAQSKELAEKCEEVKRWEERWNEQKELNAEAIEILMEKAGELERLEDKIVSLREEVEDQQRARSDLEIVAQGWEQVGTESGSSSPSEVVMKVREERWSDDELYGICLGYNW